MKEYRHYGNNHFEPDRFRPIKTEPYDMKPVYGTGFWACPKEDTGEYSWARFLEENPTIRNHKHMWKHFDFTLYESAKVVRIAKVTDFLEIEEYILDLHDNHVNEFIRAEHDINDFTRIPPNIYIDFERAAHDGIDAIELDLTENYWILHYMLYNWDVNSILIMNKDIIIPK